MIVNLTCNKCNQKYYGDLKDLINISYIEYDKNRGEIDFICYFECNKCGNVEVIKKMYLKND